MSRLLVFAALALASTASAQVNGPAPCTNGSATLGGRTYACNGIDLLSIIPLDIQSTGAMNDIWGWTDPVTGREYALGGNRSGTVMVDVTDGANPLFLGKLPTQSGNSAWRDIKTRGNYAFVVSEAPNHGMQVFDLTRLRGLAADPTRTFTADAVYSRFGNAHNLVINEQTGFAYAVGFGNRTGMNNPASCNVPGFHAVNIQNPLAPTFAGCFNDGLQEVRPVTAAGYTHDAQCIVYDGPDADYTGREICFAANEDVVTIFDVTDKADVRLLSQTEYPNSGYTHQGWLTEDRRTFLVDDEFDASLPGTRTIMLDVVDLDNPEFVANYSSPRPTYAHNLYVRGNYAYASNYESGLHVMDLASVASGQLSEVAFFDSYPQGDSRGSNNNYEGNWSNYPYFASGNIVMSDINNGLFVVRPTTINVVAGEPAAPRLDGGYALTAATPNPTTSASRLTLSVGAAQAVTAEVYDVTGRRVRTAFAGTAAPGTPVEIGIDASSLAAGVYVVRVTGETFAATERLVVTR